jgi:hypothetical protein
MYSAINITGHVLEVNLISSLQEVRCDFHDIIINKLEKTHAQVTYEACPESKQTKVLNIYNNFNLQERHC